MEFKVRWNGRTRHRLLEYSTPDGSKGVLEAEARSGNGCLFLNCESYERARRESDFWGIRCRTPKTSNWVWLPVEAVQEMISRQEEPREHRDRGKGGGPFWTLELKDILRINRERQEVSKGGSTSLNLRREQLKLLGFPESYDSSPNLETIQRRCRERRLKLQVNQNGRVTVSS